MSSPYLTSRVALALPLLFLLGCEDPAPASDAGADDAGSPADSAVPRTCEAPPPPSVAPTPATQALADAPARCGQAAHVWLRSAELGDVVSVSDQEVTRASVLAGLAVGAEVTLPQPPVSDVGIRVVTYLTQDRGALIEATTGVAYPLDTMDAPLEVVLLPHGTTGFADGCGASNDPGSRILASLLASYGYFVVFPDYLGLKNGGEPTGFPHPYLVGQATAIASLDAMRAGLKMDIADRGGNCAGTRYVSVGGSQGGHAVLFIDRLAPYYAAELTHLGVVATVPPSDLVGQSERALTELVNATGNVTAFLGTSPFWYGAGGDLDQIFVSPYDVDVPAELIADCSPSAPDLLTLDDVFAGPLLTAAGAGTLAGYGDFGCMFSENSLTTTSIERLGGEGSSYGILFVLGEADELVNTPIERTAYATLCDAGMPMQYLECVGAGHVDTTFWSFQEILRFVAARFDEEPFVADCTVSAPVTCEGTPTP